jgi:hypothetical protein
VRWSFLNCSPSMGVVDTGLAQGVNVDGKTRPVGHERLRRWVPPSASTCPLALLVVLTQPRPRRVQNEPFPLAVLSGLLDTVGKGILLSPKTGPGKGSGGGIATSQDHRVVPWGGEGGGVLWCPECFEMAWNTEAIQPWEQGSRGAVETVHHSADGDGGQRWMSLPSFVIRRVTEYWRKERKKLEGMTCINPLGTHRAVCAFHAIAMRDGSLSTVLILSVSPPFLMRVTNGALAPHCQERLFQLPWKGWPLQEISSLHQPSTVLS